MMVWLMLLVVFAVSCYLTLVLRRYALNKNLIDAPTDRSSHTAPTPRGGGVAIVSVYLMLLPVLYVIGVLPVSWFLALFGAGVAVSAIGFLDDHGHVAARWRLLVHFLSAVFVAFLLKGLPPIILFTVHINFGWFGYAFVVLYLMWMLNLYNFMDGIDGIAGVEAICVCVGGALLYWMRGEYLLSYLPLLLAATVAGFLVWNFPQARIFMGDAGSGFLGIVLGVFSLQAAWVSPELLWAWLILLGVFIVDASLTLARRLFQGEAVYQAHRSHAYQHAARYYRQHKAVTLGVVFINVFWLTPIAILVGYGRLDGACGLILAYSPLIALAIKFNAGRKELEDC